MSLFSVLEVIKGPFIPLPLLKMVRAVKAVNRVLMKANCYLHVVRNAKLRFGASLKFMINILRLMGKLTVLEKSVHQEI